MWARLTQWDPFYDLFTTTTLSDWLFGETFAPRWTYEGPGASFAYDVVEDPEGYTVRAVLPGINPNDLDISLSGQTLTIRGEVKEQELPQGARYYLRERATGRFARSIEFPVPLDADAVQANYEQGVLTVRVPKAAEVRPRRISVQAQPTLIEGQAVPILEEKTTAA